MAGITFPTQDARVEHSPGSFSVSQVSGHRAYYAGRTALGQACLLIATSDVGRTVPLLLVGLEVFFSIPCRIREYGEEERTETLTAAICMSSDPAIEEYFSNVCETLIQQFGPNPSAVTVEEGILFLVDLFRKLGDPSKREVIGLAGELCVIHEAGNADRAVEAWRSEKTDRYDFAVGTLRIEAKASSSRDRRHSFSLEQTRPSAASSAFVASIFIEAAGGGTSLAALIRSIEGRLTDPDLIGRFRLIIADSLGERLPLALRWRFDLELARASLAFFDISTIPSLVGDIPAGVSQVRFLSDLGSCSPTSRNGKRVAEAVTA
ncbi:PD-(D/E)XK motif protein [Devosia indica]|uniref:PD-(D/E)XK motif protein n=1 Tax=Devosia indica TaxID=2079253 RepID=UPI0013007868